MVWRHFHDRKEHIARYGPRIRIRVLDGEACYQMVFSATAAETLYAYLHFPGVPARRESDTGETWSELRER